MVRDPESREELGAAIRELEKLLAQVQDELCEEPEPKDGEGDEHD